MGLFRSQPAAAGDLPRPGDRPAWGKTWAEVDDGTDDDEWQEGDEEGVPAPPRRTRVELRRAWIKLALVLALPFAIGGVGAAVPHDLFRTIVACSILLLCLPLILVAWLDVARALSEVPALGFGERWLRVFMCVPQALLGLVTLLIGLGIMGWVLYNSCVERLPQYTGGFLTFGISTASIAAGWTWLREASRTASRSASRAPTATSGTLPS